MIENEFRAAFTFAMKGHPNVINVHEVLELNDANYLIMDLIRGNDFFKFMQVSKFSPIPEKHAKFLFKQLMSGISHIHSQGIAHRDIKLENILVTSRFHLTIIDFGLCTIFDPSPKCDHANLCDFLCKEELESKNFMLSRDFVGSDNFIAPEILKRAPYCPFKADVWSAGIVLYCMVFGQFPWNHRYRVQQVKESGINPPLELPTNPKVSDSVKNLLLTMLTENPCRRISVHNVLESDWFVPAVQ